MLLSLRALTGIMHYVTYINHHIIPLSLFPISCGLGDAEGDGVDICSSRE